MPWRSQTSRKLLNLVSIVPFLGNKFTLTIVNSMCYIDRNNKEIFDASLAHKWGEVNYNTSSDLPNNFYIWQTLIILSDHFF